MAEVYLAVAGGPSGFTKLQVLKVLKPDLSDQDRTDFARMFEDEGRLAARLNHPNIVQSHEVGSQDGHDFIAMEYLEGQPLSRVEERGWASGREFPLEMQLHVLSQVLEGLEYAHTLTDYDGTPLNIVHRDISPQNVFITYAGHTKLVDFGIAKTLESCKTRAGVVKGKVPYMSPEQVLAGHIDHRADIFSVGVMLWEAIAGHHMHGDATVYEILRRLVQGDLPKIRDVAPHVSPELERIVTRALVLSPEHRYPNAAAFRDELASVMDGFRKVTPREIGERVTSLFADERREINEVIRQAMTEARNRAVEPGDLASVHLLPTLRLIVATGGQSSATTGTRPAPPASALDVADSALPPEPESKQNSEPTRARGKTWRIAAVVAVTLAGLGGAWTTFGSRPGGAGMASDEARMPVAATEPKQPPPQASVRVSLRVLPETATLILDRMVIDNPYTGTHARDDRPHTLQAIAPGFAPRTLSLRFDRDVDMEVGLAQDSSPEVTMVERSPAPAAAPRPPANARPVIRSATAGQEPQKSGDPYGEFPKVRTHQGSAPPLDTSDPWVAQ